MRFRGEDAVSPVIGTVLVLGISVAGIGAVLFWGAPLIQEMQDRNSEASLVSDMLQVRQATGRLTGIDSSRSIGINLPAGTLAVQEGGHMLVTASHEADCRTDLDGWTDGDVSLSLTFGPAPDDACTGPAQVSTGILPIPPSSPGAYLYRLDDGAHVDVPIAVTVGGGTTVVSDQPIDIETYDWLLEIRNTDGDVLQQHWMLRSDVLSWEQQSSGSDRAVLHAWGPVLVRRDAAVFAEGHYFATESAFQSDDYYLRLNALRAPGEAGDSISDPGARGVLMALSGIEERAGGQDKTHALRFETYGVQDEAFCNTFGLRNVLAGSGTLYDPSPCEADGDAWYTDYAPSSVPFRFEFLHATISVDIQL